MDSKEITSILGRKLFEMGHSPICANFQTMSLHECDIISINSGGSLCEFEIKISASDFKADFKKIFKHNTLKNGPYIRTSRSGEITHLACSYFTYVCPACLIREDQIPAYAGLIWIHSDGRIDHKIKAPQLYKAKADPSIIKKIAHNLTQKQLFGGSHMSMVAKENKNREADNKEARRRNQFNMMVLLLEKDPKSHDKRMLENNYNDLFKAGSKEFPEELTPLVYPSFPQPIPILKDAESEKLKDKKIVPIPEPIPEAKQPQSGKRKLVKKTGFKRR